jgi:hypothetical protein
VTHWNVVFIMAPNDYATNIKTMLTAFDGLDNIIIYILFLVNHWM